MIDETLARTPAAGRLRASLIWLLVGPLALWTLVRVLGIEAGYPLVPLLAFTPYVAAASVVLLGASLALRNRAAAAVTGLAVIVLAGCVLPRAFAGPSTVYGPQLVVMATNMRVGGADPAAIMALVRAHHVQVLTVQELTPAADAALARAGLRDVLPYAESHPVDGVGASAVYSRFPLSDGGVTTNADSGPTTARSSPCSSCRLAFPGEHTTEIRRRAGPGPRRRADPAQCHDHPGRVRPGVAASF